LREHRLRDARAYAIPSGTASAGRERKSSFGWSRFEGDEGDEDDEGKIRADNNLTRFFCVPLVALTLVACSNQGVSGSSANAPIGEKADLDAFLRFLQALEAGVSSGIAAEQSVEQLQENLAFPDYAEWLLYDVRRRNLIAEAYQLLTEP